MVNRKASMPFWCVGNPVGDPFGVSVMDSLSSLEVGDILCWAKKEKLIDFTSAHDDDLVSWDPKNPEDDLDPKSRAYKTLRELKRRMDKVGLPLIMITCNLHTNPVFRNGGLTNPDPEIRILAARKVMRALRIGNFFGAKYSTYWVARDGFETQFAVPWDRCYKYIIEGLNLVTKYARKNKLSIKHGTVENKPNEPRGEMFLPTVGHAMALIERLDEPDFWGVNPELLQHEEMTGLSASAAAGFTASLGKLFFLHFGNQKPGQFDNDNPPLIGMDGIKETVGIFWILDLLKWNGHVEFDCHVLRTDCAPGKTNAVEIRKDFIRMCVEALRMVEKVSDSIAKDGKISKMQAELWDSKPALAKILSKGDIAAINKAKVDIDKAINTPIEIGRLDLAVNKKMFGK
jgi:xylose isomerase